MKKGKFLVYLGLVIFGTALVALRLSLAQTAADVTIPNAPSSLLLEPASTLSTIYLKWTDNSSNETSFNIDRKFVSDGNYAGTLHWGTTGANVTTFIDSNVSSGQHYDYRVQACNAIGCSDYINKSDAVTASPYCSALSLTANKSSYVKGEDVNYTYTCSSPSATTTIQSATVQVVKPGGVATTYNTGSGSSTTSLGFSTSNLDAGAYTLRVCLDSACTTAGMATWAFAVTAPTTSSTNANSVNHTWTFTDGSDSSSILVRTDAEYTAYISSVDSQCRQISKTKFSWKTGAGDDSAANWKNFGIPDCSGTASTTTTPSTSPTPTTAPATAGSCESGNKCAKGSWCSNGSKCFYPDSQVTCVAYPPSGMGMGGAIECPTGTSVCDPSDTNCVAPGQTVPYASGKWCSQSQSYYSSDGKNITCVSWSSATPAGYSTCRPGDTSCISENSYGASSGYCTNATKCYQKATDSDTKNDVYCAKQPPAMAGAGMMPADVSCPSGYSLCSPTDMNCKQKGDKWIDSGNYSCMSSQKCTTSLGGSCVGWNETCPTGSKYCSASDTYCVEPGEYKTIATSSNNSSYWCGGGNGMVFYSGTQAYCEKKAGATTTSMWTSDDVKAVLTKLGAGWGLCAAGNTNCIEPGKTGSSNSWCAWYPPNNTMSMSANGAGPRTCPSLDGTTVPPPPPPPPVECKTVAPLCKMGETAVMDQNGCYTAPCTPIKKMICPLAPVIASCPSGQALKSTVNGDGCSITSCIPSDEMRECGSNEMSNSNNMCMMPMYRWNIAAKTYEKCDIAAKKMPYMNPKDNLNAKYTNCESMNYEFEREWKTKRNLVHPPEKFGDYYWPPWDAAAKQFQYKPETDQFGECDARTFSAASGVMMPTYSYMAPCTPVPDEDKEWLLAKFRSEYKMYQLYQKQNPATPVKPGLPIPPIIDPLPLPVVPVIQVAQCKPYLNTIRQSLSSDKMFWKDVKRNFDQVPQYPEADIVSQALDQAKILIVDIDKLMKAAKCDSDTLSKLQSEQNTLHSDLFSELSSHLPALQDFAEGAQCRVRLTTKQKQLQDFAKTVSEDKKEEIQDLLDAFSAKFKEFDTRSSDFDYDLAYECQEFSNEMESQTNDLTRVNDKELNRIIDDVISKQLQSVIADLTKQIEDRGKKLDDLLVRVAQLHKTLDAVTKSATEISQKITVSYAGLSRIDEKFSEQKTQMQTAKDELIPSVSEATRLMKETACVQGAERDMLIRKAGEIATINWVDAKADDIERRLNLFIASCKAKDVAKGDADAFVKSVDDLAVQNAQASYKDGLTFDPAVPTHEWFYGAFQTAYKSGYVTQARPGEAVLAQDALIMILKATGDTPLLDRCTFQPGTVSVVSPYAICAINRAKEKGILLPSDMTVPVTRARIAEWITHVVSLPQKGSDSDLKPYTDLGNVSVSERSSIADVVLNQIMVGSSTDGVTFSFKPKATLTRAALVVILEQLSALAH